MGSPTFKILGLYNRVWMSVFEYYLFQGNFLKQITYITVVFYDDYKIHSFFVVHVMLE